MSGEQPVIYFHTQLTMDNKHVNMHIPSDPRAHLSLFNRIKFETPITGPRALIELTSQNPQLRFPPHPPPPSPPPGSTLAGCADFSGQKKHLASACLFLCSLAIYSPLSLIFSPPPSPNPPRPSSRRLVLPCGFLSHTGAAERERFG